MQNIHVVYVTHVCNISPNVELSLVSDVGMIAKYTNIEP